MATGENIEKIKISNFSDNADVMAPDNVEIQNDDRVDYHKLIENYGCSKIDEDLLHRFEKITGQRPHHFLRRGIFFSHRNMHSILNLYEQGKPFYLYILLQATSHSMDLGQLVPFMFCKWLQEVFDVPLVIQLKINGLYISNDWDIDKAINFSYVYAKDIIACGFKFEKTFIFSDIEYMDLELNINMLQIEKNVTLGEIKKVFSVDGEEHLVNVTLISKHYAPVISTSFPFFFKDSKVACLIPCAIDQDPYFKLITDVISRFDEKYPKLALLHSILFPALQGPKAKISASDKDSAIFLTDTQKQIEKKINKYAFSGGQATIEEHRKLGGNCDVDVSYQWLRFFLEDDEKLEKIRQGYTAGEILTGNLKKELISVLQNLVAQHEKKRAEITDDLVKQYMTPRNCSLVI